MAPEPGREPYDHAVDPITARRVLRIFPDAPLTADLVERAYSGELESRHPARYLEGPDRARAEEWARTLGAARGVLLAEARMSTAGWPAPDLAAAVHAPRSRGLSGGAVVGIIAGAVALVLVVVAGAVGITGLVGTLTEAARALETELASPPGADDTSDGEDPDVDRYTADETMFTFPAAIELYYDGRHNGDCPMDYVEGCWQAAIITEADCDALQVQLGFANDADATAPEHTENMDLANVTAGETTPVVYGHDDYVGGWLDDVRCLDSGRAPRNSASPGP